MTRTNLSSTVERLGHEFRRRGMHRHLRSLRLFWLAEKHGLLDGRRAVDVRFSEALVTEWLKTLRLPPHERTLQVLAKGAPCPRCGPALGTVRSMYTEFVFEGGYRVKCGVCELEWVVEEFVP